MKKTTSAGGVVLNKHGKVLVVAQGGTSWSLPKGHVEKNEDLVGTARREIEEESGINNLEFVSKLGKYKRPNMADANEQKTIHMFLFKTNELKLNPVFKREIPEAKWVNKDEVEELLTAEKDKMFFKSIKNKL